MVDKVFIRHLKVSAQIGVCPWERESRQDITFDIDIETDANQIAKTDDINHTVDYAKVRDCVNQFVMQHRFNLIETLAHEIAELLIENFNIQWLRLTLTKPGAFDDETIAGITLERKGLMSNS